MWYRFEQDNPKGICRVKQFQVAWYDMEQNGDCFDEDFVAPNGINRVIPYVETVEDENNSDRSRVFVHMDNGEDRWTNSTSKHAYQEHKCWVKAIEIVKQEAEQCEECYKDCGDCEAYNKEKHHCPKFCKVITEAVKEIEENHNKGKWEMTYKGKRKDVNTGLMISAYNCKCSVCGWETGNQGTRFSYCPKCGAKMDEVNKPKGE